MKVAVYTLTRDRLEYTKRSFQSLRIAAGHPYDHYVIDNGSEDGTREWLSDRRDDFANVQLLDQNMGISGGANLALDAIAAHGGYDLVFKMDNDCILLDKDLMKDIVNVYVNKSRRREYMLSPRVVGLNRQPKRSSTTRQNGTKIGWVRQVGGLCHVASAKRYLEFRYSEHLPKAWGQDEQICTWMHSRGVYIGYCEDVLVEHCDTTDGQARRYPEYFERKRHEEAYEATA